MIIRVEASNFRSIDENILFPLSNTKNKEHQEKLLKISENLSTVPVAAIFGKNASGKTNILEVVNHIAEMVINSHKFLPDKPIPFNPFILTDKIKKTSKFEILFFCNETLYLYFFEQSNTEIIEEKLYHFRNMKQALVFQKIDGKYSFGRDYLRLKGIIDRTHNNKLFLSVAAQWSPEIDDIMNPFKYFLNNIDFNVEGMFVPKFRNRTKDWNNYTTELLYSNSKAKEFFLNLMKMLDTGIIDVDIKKIKIEGETLSALPEELKAFILNQETTLVGTETNVVYLVNNVKYKMDITQESQGIQRLFQLTGMLFDAINDGKILIVDEIESGLHPIIVREIVKIFKNNQLNTKKSQLIFTTHDQTLCDLSLFRRDEIYFTERKLSSKDDEKLNAGTVIFRLSDIQNVRITENVQKNYMNGVYTTIPEINASVF